MYTIDDIREALILEQLNAIEQDCFSRLQDIKKLW